MNFENIWWKYIITNKLFSYEETKDVRYEEERIGEENDKKTNINNDK